jgi:putative restriction endonuclease
VTERSDDRWLSDTDLDSRVRLAAFAFLAEQLMGPQGIFKPAVLDMPLSITTVPIVEGRPRPYEDEIDPDGLLIYRYRGTDPEHRDNRGLRLAMARKAPLIYFDGVDSRQGVGARADPEVVAEARRQYVISTVRHRVHQVQFRYRVLKAYREHCAVCRLRHSELLDAAHILPDGHPRGEPVVPNGLALCKLHHAAFDRHILGVRPDLVIEIRHDILEEADGPMLRHGLQGFQGARITVPGSVRLKPHPDYLAERYELFRKAS